MNDLFGGELEKVERKGLLRKLRRIDSSQGRAVTIDGREILLFCSNNYLGLANHPKITNAAVDCISSHGWGSGASRLISGSMSPHLEFEERVAQFLDKPAALLYSSGYSTNVGIITSLMGRSDSIYADRLCHASIIDGVRWSGAEYKRYKHKDPDDLKGLLEKGKGRGKRLIVSDGVFSMDGDIAPLKELAELAERYGAILMIDDAHGFGVLGPDGRGVVHEAGMADRIDIHVATLGKALGGAGGFVAGSRNFIDGLVNFSRSFIYSTAPPPPQAAAGLAALDIIVGPEGVERRERLMTSVEKIISRLNQIGCNTGHTKSQIVPVFIGKDDLAMRVSELLLEHNILAPVIRPPTVPKGSGRIRLSITADHVDDDLERLLNAFVDLSSLLRD